MPSWTLWPARALTLTLLSKLLTRLEFWLPIRWERQMTIYLWWVFNLQIFICSHTFLPMSCDVNCPQIKPSTVSKECRHTKGPVPLTVPSTTCPSAQHYTAKVICKLATVCWTHHTEHAPFLLNENTCKEKKLFLLILFFNLRFSLYYFQFLFSFRCVLL